MKPLDPRAARIVLLDDDSFMLTMLARMLAQLGYTEVIACESGEKALQQVAAPEAPVNLIFLDINMPGMDGVEFIRRLVECRYSGSVILVSGEDARILESVEKLIEAQQLTALGHLQKPVKPKELATLMGHLKPNAGRGTPRRVTKRSYGMEQLRAAIAHGELVNHYQPKVALATGEVIGGGEPGALATSRGRADFPRPVYCTRCRAWSDLRSNPRRARFGAGAGKGLAAGWASSTGRCQCFHG
jgi:CheY-like chemotaxis protein